MASGMSPERWQIVKGVFAAARKAPSRDRAAIVESLCDDDSEIREQVFELLRHENEMPELDTPSRWLGLPQTDGERPTDGASAALPERVGSYAVIRLIGAGRFGAVYEAVQPKTRRNVALKVLKLGRTGAQALQRFEFEATALARLSHPGIAQIYEAGVDTGTGEARPFLAMEMVEGVEITAYATRERLDRRARARLVMAVCDAAQHAHERGIVHLDLKPANIVVNADGKPKIVDFGVAMVSDTPDESVKKPAERSGTIPYMSPEQLAGRIDEIDLRSDVYALGVLLYELIEGKLPREIRGQSYLEAILRAKAGGEFPFGARRGAWGGVDGTDLRAVVRRATAALREERYPSALEMGMDLRRLLQDRPVGARRASVWYVARKFIKRRRGLSAVIAAAALGLVGIVVWSAWWGREARADAAVARELVTLVLNEEVARIADTQGTQEARRLWLGHVGPRVTDLLSRHPEDPGIALVAARLLILESDVEHESANMQAAYDLRMRALSLRSGATLARQTDERSLMDLSINLVKVGDICLDRGKSGEGRRYYERAFAIDRELAARPGASLEALDNLSWSYDRMKRFVPTQSDRRDLCFKQIDLAQDLILRNPNRSLSWFNSSHAKLSLADLCEDEKEKEHHLRGSLADARRATALNSDSRTVYRVMIESLRRVTELTVTDSPSDEARSMLRELDTLADELRTSERRDVYLCASMLHARLSIAQISLRWGDRRQATEQLDEVEAALRDYTIALAGRPDEANIRARYAGLAEEFAKTAPR